MSGGIIEIAAYTGIAASIAGGVYLVKLMRDGRDLYAEEFGDIVELPTAARCGGGRAARGGSRDTQSDVRTHRRNAL